VEMRSKMVNAVTARWRLWLALGLGVLGTLSAVLSLSIGSNTMFIFLALSVPITLVILVQFSPVVRASSILALTGFGFPGFSVSTRYE
jgi:hypothetical protein